MHDNIMVREDSLNANQSAVVFRQHRNVTLLGHIPFGESSVNASLMFQVPSRAFTGEGF